MPRGLGRDSLEIALGSQDCIESLMQQYQVSAKPARAIVWLTHSNIIPKAAQCAKVAQIQKACPFAYPGPSSLRTLLFFAPRSVRRPLLTLQVNPGSLYRCGQER